LYKQTLYLPKYTAAVCGSHTLVGVVCVLLWLQQRLGETVLFVRYALWLKKTILVRQHVRTQNFSLGGADPVSIYNLCLVLKILLQKLCH
jgi:hypothetical protein